jgi:hypothetical protein
VAAAMTSDISLVIVGRPRSRWWQRPIGCRVELDGDLVGSVRHHGELAVVVAPGRHVLSAGIGRARSMGCRFEVDRDDTIYVDVVPNRAIRLRSEQLSLRFSL